ncbi:hypothetical protein [uncultured Erythrobacter sp.]|uniref:hypothetical protein n=1 Tax=uncultured Erythrobacter sp. TaxID=263913 RepID=UPI00262989BF|nr:hypothetical protein [uncultured Erythrobacter sp.]
MKRILGIALAAAIAGQAAPLAAENYAETAAQLANAIRTGDTDTQRETLPPLTTPEYAEIADLANCDAYMGSAGGAEYLVIDWICPSVSGESERKRSTLMLFDDHGELLGFAINARIGDLAPSEAALTSTDLPMPRSLLRDFAEAVTSGEDASLGGLINLGEFELARLALYRSGNFRVSRSRLNGNYHVLFYEGSRRSGLRSRAVLQFDEQGRPIGLLFTPTYFPRDRSRYHDDRRFTQRLANERASIRSRCAVC